METNDDGIALREPDIRKTTDVVRQLSDDVKARVTSTLPL